MKKSECAYIGKLLKPHGVKGELSVKFEPEFLKNFNRQKFIFIEIFPGDDLVPFYIESAEADSSGMGRIKFDDYNSIDAVRNLVNKNIFIPGFFHASKTKKNSTNQLIGFSVSEKKYGTIGIVEDLIENPQQQILLLRNNDREILIPFVKEFIVKTDKKAKIIYMNIPEGLLDIND